MEKAKKSANFRTALILFSIVLAFFVGIIIKRSLLA